MQTLNIRDKLYLYGGKALLIIVLLIGSIQCQAQRNRQIFNPDYDAKWVSYGFLLGVHTNTYQLKYSDQFTTPAFDSLYSISPKWSTGFDLGFIINFRVAEFFDLRLTPTVSFNDYVVRYRPIDDVQFDEVRESTVVELPILLKYKSERHGNSRMYMIGGINPAFEASGKNDFQNLGDDNLNTATFNVSLDVGIGLDVYYPLFKLSPELRFSKGLMNMVGDRNEFSAGIDRLNTNTISLLFFFQ